MTTTSPPVASPRRLPGMALLGLGIALSVLGPVLYVMQVRAKMLTTPWYLPALATAGVALLFLAVLLRPTVWRILPLVLCGLLAGAEWYFLVAATRLPAYTGPVSAGAPFPVFRTSLADGTAFDQDNFRGAENTAVVFFRGRW